MKAIGYFTVPGGQRQDAVHVHEEAFSAFCQRHGHQALATLVDSDPQEGDRPKYVELLSRLKQEGSEFLVVISGPEDLGDRLEASVRRILELDALGAKIVNYQAGNPDPLQQALKVWGSGRGSGLKGERIKEAMRARAIRGRGLGKPPFGYRIGKDGKLEETQEEGATVRLIYRLYTQDNLGMRRIVKHLNENEIPSRSGGGWSIVTVRDVLRNRTYLGTYTRFGMRIPGSHQALIDSTEFNLAQQTMASKKSRRVAHHGEPFLLSGLAFCAACGNKMIGVTRRQGWNRKDGSSAMGHYRYYQCQSRTNQGMCRYHTWRSQALEQTVVSRAKEALESGGIAVATGPDPRLRLAAERTAWRLTSKFAQALEMAAAGTISLAQLRLTQEEVDVQRAVLETDPQRENPMVQAFFKGDSQALLHGWESLEGAALGLVVRGLVQRVSVGDSEIEITLHQQEG